MDKRLSILIAAPCFADVSPEVLSDWMRFAYHCGRYLPQYDFAVGIRSKAEQFRARNSLVEGAMSIQADYILMLDDDMIIDANVTSGKFEGYYNLIEKLLVHDKDIIGALYYQRTGGCMPVAMMESGETGYRFLRPDELTGGLQQVDVAGGGALLVKMSVFDRLPHPFFAPEHQFGTDVQLCRAAKKIGLTVWLDSSIELGHVRDERVIITSRNRQQYAMESTLPGEAKSLITADVYASLLEDAMQYTGFYGVEEMGRAGQRFMTQENRSKFNPIAWYNEYPMERVARQVWFNSANNHKRQMTEFILATINDAQKAQILDFGCGIGIPAFEFAKRGHHVTACDLKGTGTLGFLAYRAGKHGVPITIVESDGEVPFFSNAQFGAIVAMDCLEHIPDWRGTLLTLLDYLAPGGILFCNNGILDDQTHPEHYPMDTKEFVKFCIDIDLQPANEIMYMKKVKA